MCKVNGHSIFSYGYDANPFKDWKRFNSKNEGKAAAALAQQKAAEAEMQKVIDANKADKAGLVGEMPAPVTPVETKGTGLNNQSNVGLNLI